MARSLGATPIHLLQTARNLPIQTPLSDESSCLVITVPCPSDWIRRILLVKNAPGSIFHWLLQL